MPNSVKSQEERYPISPCTESDIHQMFSVYYSAFSTSPIHALLFPPTVTLSSIETWFCNKTAEQMKRPDIRFFKITDARTGYIVAFVRLGYPQNSTVIVDVQSQLGDDVTDGTDTVKTQKFDAEDMPAGTNGTFGQAKFGPLKTWRDKYIDYEEDYVAYLLVTHPTQQRKGFANRLLKMMTDQADGEGRKCYIEASPAGFGLYQKCGFTEIDRVLLELDQFGGDNGEVGVNVCMIRHPNNGKVDGAQDRATTT